MSFHKRTAIIISTFFFFCNSVLAGGVTMAPALMPNFPMLAGKNVMIMWVPVPGAVRYKIYKNGKPIGETPAPPFKASAPEEPGIYKYKITGIDKDGKEGPASMEGELSIVKMMPPANISARFLGEVLNLRWDPAPNAVIYDIFRAESEDGPYKLISSVTETRYVDQDIRQREEFYGKTFYYRIVSKNKINETSGNEPGLVVPYKPIELKAIPIKKHKQKPRSKLKQRPKKNTRAKKQVLKRKVNYTDSWALRRRSGSLSILRSKEVVFKKPIGGIAEIQSCFDAVFLSDGENLVCVDTFAKRVAIIDQNGEQARVIGSAGDEQNQYLEPIAVAVDEKDDIFILDRKKLRILVYSSDGTFKSAIDIRKIEEYEIVEQYNEFMNSTKYKVPNAPQKLVVPVIPNISAIIVNGKWIYAPDYITGAIQIYNKSNGKFAGYIRNIVTNEILYYRGVSKMVLDENGLLYFAKPYERKISVIYINTGEFVYTLGYSNTFIGAFASINGMALDKFRNILVSDSVMSSVQVFSKDDGGYMYHIGDKKAVPDERSKNQRPYVDNLDSPGPVCVDKKGRLWVYLGKDKVFTVREYIEHKPWSVDLDKPEL